MDTTFDDELDPHHGDVDLHPRARVTPRYCVECLYEAWERMTFGGVGPRQREYGIHRNEHDTFDISDLYSIVSNGPVVWVERL